MTEEEIERLTEQLEEARVALVASRAEVSEESAASDRQGAEAA